ncbi:MAG: hypothetical protein EOO88_01615 [Pedobacter sp.]|nr:MAG: hypothetical protein EOO88_01615 [Pedobacter sp.]
MTAASGQDKASIKDPRYQKYAGRYGGSSGVVLFDDGTYLLYGYATAVFGTYRFEKDRLVFSADRQEVFQVYGHRNPSLTKGNRINFVGFERGSKPLVQLGTDNARPVFNDAANCFSGPFVYVHPGKLDQFTLAAPGREFSGTQKAANVSATFINKEGYNDFIFLYNAPSREREDFVGQIASAKEGEILRLSNYGGAEGYVRRKEEKATNNWKEIDEMKSQYQQNKVAENDILYANPHYQSFDAPDSSRYHYDKTKNVYTAREEKENQARYMQDQYNDPTYLRQYQEMTPNADHSVQLIPKSKATSLFFTVCGEGSERSYKYTDYIEYKITDPEPPVILHPVRIKNQ